METDHIHFKIIGSTNSWAKENVHAFDQQKLTVITAEEQTAGRGRYKRTWVSPPNVNIYATYCFFTDELSSALMNVAQVLPLSMAKVLEAHAVFPSIKWPNDLLLSQKKVSGILCETVGTDGKFCVVLGIGLNVNMTKEEIAAIDRPATSLLVETGSSFALSDLIEELNFKFKEDLEFFLKNGFFPFFEEYNARFFKSDHIVDFYTGSSVIQGKPHSINPDGSLNFYTDDQKMVFFSGEYFL